MSEASQFVVWFDTGWYNVEYSNNLSWVWNNGDSELKFDDEFDSVDIEFSCGPNTKNNLSINFENYELKSNDALLTIPIKNVNYIKFKCDTFIPHTINLENKDERILGLMLKKLIFKKDNKCYIVNVENILSKQYYDVHKITKITHNTKQKCIKKIATVFDKLYCITCFESGDRQELVKKQFDNYKLNYEFIPAINRKFITDGLKISKPDASLCLTHKQCIESAKLNNYQSILIFEDDFKFNNEWYITLLNFIESLPYDWDLLYLGYADWTKGLLDNRIESINKFVDRTYTLIGTHLIAINSSIYDVCINLFDTLEYPADICYMNIIKDVNFKCYIPKISIADALSIPHEKYHDKIKNFNKNNYIPSKIREFTYTP